jgi:hypothetical protein
MTKYKLEKVALLSKRGRQIIKINDLSIKRLGGFKLFWTGFGIER